jgi:NADH:ubiquinone oxidoreductase subunit K
MSKSAVLGLSSLLFVFALARVVYAADETLVEQFLGSPLLILAAVIIIAALASLYHRIRK